MAVREFTDSRGVEWRVWDVTPAQMHPVTRGLDYMADLQDGWLAFETGREKRRLEIPYPSNWMELPLDQLEELCRRASPVLRRKRSPSGERKAISAAEIERGAIDDAVDEKTFISPGGREWRVRVHERFDSEGQQQKVLRFTADGVILELLPLPDGWERSSVREYAIMMLDAEPPRRLAKGKGPQRRGDDRGT